MPRKHSLPNRRDGLSLRGVKFEDALRAAMATPLPPEMRRGGKKPPRPHKHADEGADEGATDACPVCRRGAKGEEE